MTNQVKMPDDNQLNIMWSVSTSSSIESGTKPHIIFAKLLYNHLFKVKPIDTLAEKES